MAYDDSSPDRAHSILSDVDKINSNLDELRKFEASSVAPSSPEIGQFWQYTPGSGNYVMRVRDKSDASWLDFFEFDASDIFYPEINMKASGVIQWAAASAAADIIVKSTITAESYPRFQIKADGTMEWGGGSGAVDVSLARSAANVLQLSDQLYINENTLKVVRTLGTSEAVNVRVSGESYDRFNIDASGKMQWGAGSTDVDCVMFRGAANRVDINDQLRFNSAQPYVNGAAAGSAAFDAQVSGDSYERFIIYADGKMTWGSGAATRDVTMERSAADTLKLSDVFQVERASVVSSYQSFITGDTYNRFDMLADGKMQWGSGSAIADTNLYRSAANALKTDDSIEAAGGFIGNGASLAVPGRVNLLKNTQWIVMSNSDTNRGIGAMTFDAGQTAAPAIGALVTGSTSGATGKIMTVTVATGSWGTNDAAGTMTLGACAGRFHDNEVFTWSGGQATVNKPDSAAGVDLIRNGDFSVDTDPPPGWTLASSAVLSTEAAGKVGNCLCITEGGAENPYAHQSFTTVVGKTYYFTCYVKAGTEATYLVRVGSTLPGFDYVNTGNKEETAGDWSTSVTGYFTATGTTAYVSLWQVCGAAAGTTMYFDEVSCYEVAPGCTAADGLTFDGWTKDSTLDVYQEHNGANTQNGSFYAAKLVPSAQNDYFYFPAGYASQSWYYENLQGRTVSFGAWVLSSTASDIRLFIYDGSANYSSYHSGGGTYEWLEATKTISTSASTVNFQIQCYSATPGIAYVSQPMLTFGSSIGAGNYVPEADRWVYLETPVTSQLFHNKTGTSGFSDVANTTLVFSSDAKGCLGHGVEAVMVILACNDVASAGTNVYFRAGTNLSNTANVYVSPYDMTNDRVIYGGGTIFCNSNGNFQYSIEASGGSTFDIQAFRYIAIKWR